MTTQGHSPQLQRHLRLFDATTLVVGSMIGSGIFIGLSIMAHSQSIAY
jgi:amino acid transporter